MTRFVIDDFRSYSRDRFIDAQTTKQARLSPTLHLTNETGVEGDIAEELTEQIWSKVIFDIPSAKVKSAELLFYVNADRSTQDKPMRVLVNGQRLSHRQNRQRMLTGGWDRLRIAAKHLKDGRNEFVFSHCGVLHIDPGPDGNSFRSFDQGKTWHLDALGAKADISGEYLVRLRLKGYAPSGQLTSPVIDLADPEGSGILAPELSLKNVRLTPQQTAPAGTRIQFELRSGATPAFDPRHWTTWQKRTALSRPGRFVQWRATLITATADKTPALKKVTLEADLKTRDKTLAGIELVELDQPEIVRSSYDFTYLSPHPRTTRLLKQYRLEDVIAPGQTELEKFALLRDWIHSQWLGWQSDKYPYTPPWDPLEILETTKGNWGYGMCTHYGAMFAGCASALGYVARVVVIDHHCLAEVWSEELQKWILEDAGPSREFDATYEVDGVPVNALELHQVLNSGQTDKLKANKLPLGKIEPMTQYVETFCRFGIPPRNDHLIFAEPAELRHGAGQYHWDGYLWWSDAIDPKYAEYSLQTTRTADFYWSVNQTRIYPQATAAKGTLQVCLETVTPNFDHYLIQIDGGPWQRAEAPLTWELRSGPNELAVRTVNIFGKAGRVSRARVQVER
ncbi:MAG: hypothetical protein GKR89_21810 [Candidatus Latescibacteria bacterium]|nr:hypothetical protein [Candidatus Latescibacterota bacterium]